LEADMARLARVDSSHLIPPASIDGATRSVAHRLQRLERRYLAAVKRKRSDAMRDVATARAALHPNGSRQERVLNFIPFLARYGRPLLGSMCNEASRHAAVLVGREGAAAEISGGPVAEPV
jgi:hypothetical protein